jgi:hypothetical protein
MGAAAIAAVSIGFGNYDPPQLHVLAGDTVTWSNGSVRQHTVSADDGSFSSGILYQGDHYTQSFPSPGVVAYYCKQHADMRGEVDVERLLLDAPAQDAAPGRPYPLAGRAALPEGTEVTIEADTGGGFAPAGDATVGADGAFSASVVPTTTGRYRAVVGDAASEPVSLVVLDHVVAAQIARHGAVVAVRTQVTPASPGADVVLQFRLRRRFGWWPVRHARLDRHSAARLTVRTRRVVRARVVLTLRDRATPLAVSPTVRARQSDD